MAAKNSIVIGVTRCEALDGSVRLGILLRLSTKPDIADTERQRLLRDVRRAIQTFGLVADIEDPNIFDGLDSGSMGPFMLAESREYASMVHAAVRPGAVEEQALGRIKQGVHAAAAIFRAAGDYRISLKVKPAVQLELPSTNGASAASVDPKGDGELAGESSAAPASDPEPAATPESADGGNGSSSSGKTVVAKKRGAAPRAEEAAPVEGAEEADELPV